MTFTFTMDAFPDYTKFDKTHKVLAAIQVIEDKYENEEEIRTPCLEPEISIKAKDSKITITYDNDSTRKDLRITATGANIIGNEKTIPEDSGETIHYDKNDFNANGELNNVNATGLDFKFMDIKNDKTYKIVQTNPSLVFYPGDTSIKDGVKTKEYAGSLLNGEEPYEIILTNRSGPILIDVYELNGNTETLTQSIRVTNKISFASIPKTPATGE